MKKIKSQANWTQTCPNKMCDCVPGPLEIVLIYKENFPQIFCYECNSFLPQNPCYENFKKGEIF